MRCSQLAHGKMELEQEASTAPTAAEEMVVEEPPVEVEPPSEPPASSNASNASVASYASPAIAAPSSTSERVRLRERVLARRD